MELLLYTCFLAGKREVIFVPLPNIVIDSWKKIWTMEEKDLGGKRSYIADFEVYDQRAADSSHAIVDIYIGVEG